jgi:hypothetical protein
MSGGRKLPLYTLDDLSDERGLLRIAEAVSALRGIEHPVDSQGSGVRGLLCALLVVDTF